MAGLARQAALPQSDKLLAQFSKFGVALRQFPEGVGEHDNTVGALKSLDQLFGLSRSVDGLRTSLPEAGRDAWELKGQKKEIRAVRSNVSRYRFTPRARRCPIS